MLSLEMDTNRGHDDICPYKDTKRSIASANHSCIKASNYFTEKDWYEQGSGGTLL